MLKELDSYNSAFESPNMDKQILKMSLKLRDRTAYQYPKYKWGKKLPPKNKSPIQPGRPSRQTIH